MGWIVFGGVSSQQNGVLVAFQALWERHRVERHGGEGVEIGGGAKVEPRLVFVGVRRGDERRECPRPAGVGAGEESGHTDAGFARGDGLTRRVDAPDRGLTRRIP